ncbi:methionine ABC transporter ATP-binding protein [Parageobacillus thermoglucosidasius]|uniref:methionine ABC transporter ATP-binding protein n=1 Tax=Parageobacillus thermoglucosidasius TaxID=1426 RepID=UPI000B55B3F2|nr:methionine ABC transporter ATP-binding protein [Parageobacillus thermoglucosidasius]MED4905739.1 methionine ABC transporter ATP-binding protein [Parageobacillus thermoglucosidasius]MED4914880.1 methionine ABC transporter ATP-binding protein [Parageobacillus thermoglucosidasius]MED4943703.1 methionine ABC transporter ATP-binding protein [Parageobacillus thermoglucosidasius]MED4984163.1 methionine ABC transporter ATP-binding protein [Parageobacillus thermoglucosidasius]OUM92597.1 MAG: methion
MIEIKNVTKIYSTKKKQVVGVDNISLTIQDGEIFGIIGYSGAGKSTLLRCLNLLERPTSGQVIIDGVDLTSLNDKQLRQARLKIGMIFQHFYLVSSKTVFENVAFALKAAKKPKEEIEKRVNELLEMVGLSDKRDAYPSQLSGGQKQRVGIARALANDPTVLLCDEATSALDPSTTKSILALLKKINRELGITIVLITHEMEVVKEICDRVAVMQNGRIIELGTVYDIFTNPQEELTKSFINSVLRFEIPDHLLQKRTGTMVKIHFKGEIAEEAVISDMLQSFKVKGNILHGKIEYIQEILLGIFVMELIGEQEEIQRAIDYISQRTNALEVIAYAA